MSETGTQLNTQAPAARPASFTEQRIAIEMVSSRIDLQVGNPSRVENSTEEKPTKAETKLTKVDEDLAELNDREKTVQPQLNTVNPTENTTNEQENERESIDVENLMTEFIRMIAIIIALLKLANKKELYSGKDLDLSIKPPEVLDNDALNKLVLGKSLTDSWKNFKEEVEKIQNVSYDTFVSLVLAAHERNNTDGIGFKKPDGKESKKTKNPFSKRGKYTTRKVSRVAAGNR